MASHTPIDQKPSPAPPNPPVFLPTAVVLLISLTALIVHARSFLPFICDDAFISLRYAERLLAGQGLTWEAGPRVEGYTNLLWILACAALGALKVDLLDAARLWGFLGMGATLICIFLAYRPQRLSESLPALAATLALALCAPIAFWTIGGMEQPFVACFLAGAVALLLPIPDGSHPSNRRVLTAGALLGLQCLTRADGGVLCIALAVGFIAAHGLNRRSVQSIARLAIGPIVLGGAQLIFRLVYYGEWLPNPAHVKVAFTLSRLHDGWSYLRDALPYLAPILLAALIAGIAGLIRPATRRRTALLFVSFIVWTGYVVCIGGDIFPAHRHLVATLVLAAMLLAEACRWIQSASSSARGAAAVAAGMICLILAATQRMDPEVQRGIEERWEWDGKIVGQFLRDAFGPSDPLIACDPAGCIPFFSKLRSIDMMGLNDYHIARRHTADFGTGVLGHELGDGRYVLDQNPDLILWTLPTGIEVPLFKSATEMAAFPEFQERYRLVRFQIPAVPPLIAKVWVSIESPKLGLRMESTRVIVPGYFAASSEKSPAVLDENRRVVVHLTGEASAVLRNVTPPPGKWKLTVVTMPVAKVMIDVRSGVSSLTTGISEVTFERRPDQPPLDIVLRPTDGHPARIRELVFEPAGG